MSPTQRALKWLRDYGYQAEVVERWIPRTKIRKDLFGSIDIIAVRQQGCLGVQATDDTSHAHRVAKALANERLIAWLLAGCEFVVYSEGLRGDRGKRKTYKPRITYFGLDSSTGKVIVK